jgi:signal peptidase I
LVDLLRIDNSLSIPSLLPASMSKQKPKTPEPGAKLAAKSTTRQPAKNGHAIRETIESIVIAFVLAFLFRTFEAEAFVIPTGSMAPTLMGRHKDVECPKCGYRYQVSASEEESEDPQRQPPSDCLAGKCPMCQYVMPMVPNLPPNIPEAQQGKIPFQRSYNGDRILVNKYLYTFTDPKRWDVVVFKFPGDAKVNYIKRLVGLPGEKLRIDQGDVYLSTDGKQYEIARKPPSKILAMRQLVHDTDYDPAELDAAGWPLRWHATPETGATAWKLEKTIKGNDVRQVYSVAAGADADSWLRYEHLTPTYEVWQDIIANGASASSSQKYSDGDRAKWRRLIMDSNPYDGRVDRNHMRFPSLKIDPGREGLHWVSDLMVEADVKIESAEGELLLDLVESGKHFTCRIDLKTGEAKLSAENAPDYSPKAKTALTGTGSHRVGFSNIDKQLLLWVDGKVVDFDSSTAYDAERVLGDRENRIPRTSDKDLGDLAPAGIGARGAKLTVNRLQVWRDLYYIAASNEDFGFQGGGAVTDFPPQFDERILNLSKDPQLWDLFKRRKFVDFKLNGEQLFVMGDNSAESSDARLWVNSFRGRPGGPYLDRRLLIGKALCVYWPHSWNQIPGTPIPFPLFPNVADMRLVR